MQSSKLILAFALCLLSYTLAQQTDYGKIVNQNVDRKIDLSSQFARHTITITLQNTGSSAASSFYLAIESAQSDKLAFLEVKDNAGKVLKISGPEAKTGFSQYKVDLATPLQAGATQDVVVREVFSHVLTPFPASIAQTERQLVQYADNHYFYSPYASTSQTTTVKLASGSIESKSEKAPTAVKGDTVTYGAYSDVEAFAVSALDIHFENNRPFLTAASVTKELEVSHWGNLAVEVTFNDLKADGAKLKGAFSRYDYQRNPAGSPAAVQKLQAVLPISAADIYYRDDIGNISTSNLNVNPRGLVMDIVPRFPLFGGWKTAFYMGYNLPLWQYLSTDVNDGSKYVLNATFGAQTDDIVIDEYTVRVILPEGAKNIEVHSPFPIDSQDFATHFTYLDTSGRPVLVIKKKNVVSEHDQFFQVTYNFSSSSLLNEPLLLAGAFFAFFLAVMAYVRINLRIGPAKRRSAAAERLDEVLARLRDIVEQRNEQHIALDVALANYWKTKSEQVYQSEKKKIESNLAICKREIAKVLNDLDQFDLETAKKVRELDRKEERKTQAQESAHANEINYKVHKRVPKNNFEDSKAEYEKAYTAADEDIENILADLTETL